DFGGFAIFPDFSPDGSKIAFSGVIGSGTNDQIYVTDSATGTAAVQLTDCPAAQPDCFNDNPVWSPDGTTIAYTHGDGFDADGNNVNEQVRLMSAAGTTRQTS